MKNKLNILITSGIFPPDIGGPASYVPKMATALTERGCNVKVICLTEGFHKDDTTYYNFQIHRIKRSMIKPWRIIKTINTIYRLGKKCDVVFANTLTFESSLGAWLSRTPIVHKIVGDYAWETARNKNWFSGTIDEYQIANKNFKLRFLDFYFKSGLKMANVIFTPSNYLTTMVKGWDVNINIMTIYNSFKNVGFNDNDKKYNDGKTHLITVCRLVSWKHVDEIILVIKNFDNTILHIVGDGPLQNDLERIVKNLELNHRVKFYGQLKIDEIIKLLFKSDIFILNSSYEGLPHVVLEAMACGTAVICNDVGGCNEVVKHMETGFLMNKSIEKRDLNSAISFYLNNTEEKKEIEKKAFNLIQTTFSFDKMVFETEALLKKIRE